MGRSSTAASEALQSLYSIATYKRKIPWVNRILGGFLGGVYLSFGGLLGARIASDYLVSSPGTAKMLYAALFPIGLMLIVFGQVDLFTSNCMIVMIGIYYDIKNKKPVTDRYRVWDAINVLLSSWMWNFVGSLCIAYFLVYQGEFLVPGSSVGKYFLAMAHKKFALSSGAVVLRAISANWLVCLAVFLANGTKNVLEKFLFIWIPIVTFVGIGLEHSVANMFSMPCAILSNVDNQDSSVTWSIFFSKNIFLVTLGNFFGGLLVAVTYFILNRELEREEQPQPTIEMNALLPAALVIGSSDTENPLHRRV